MPLQLCPCKYDKGNHTVRSGVTWLFKWMAGACQIDDIFQRADGKASVTQAHPVWDSLSYESELFDNTERLNCYHFHLTDTLKFNKTIFTLQEVCATTWPHWVQQDIHNRIRTHIYLMHCLYKYNTNEHKWSITLHNIYDHSSSIVLFWYIHFTLQVVYSTPPEREFPMENDTLLLHPKRETDFCSCGSPFSDQPLPSGQEQYLFTTASSHIVQSNWKYCYINTLIRSCSLSYSLYRSNNSNNHVFLLLLF